MRRPVLAGLAFLLLAAPAHATTARWQLTPAGDPLLVIAPEFAEYEPSLTTWFGCGPAAACRYAGSARSIAAGETAQGTIFEFETNVNLIFERSPVWRGRVAAVSPPALTGSATPGGTVKVTPASWRGGWGDELSASILLACRTTCEPFAAGQVLPQHLGATLYAVEYRVAKDAPAFTPPATRPEPSALVSVSAPVTVAAVPNDVTVELNPRAVRGKVGRVSCDCRVELSVGTVKRTFTVRKRAALTVKGVRRGRHKVAVKVDGVKLANRTVRF
jgi:hypothetical protein